MRHSGSGRSAIPTNTAPAATTSVGTVQPPAPELPVRATRAVIAAWSRSRLRKAMPHFSAIAKPVLTVCLGWWRGGTGSALPRTAALLEAPAGVPAGRDARSAEALGAGSGKPRDRHPAVRDRA